MVPHGHGPSPGPAGSSLSLHGLQELQRCRPVLRWQTADGRAEAHRVGGQRRPGGCWLQCWMGTSCKPRKGMEKYGKIYEKVALDII